MVEVELGNTKVILNSTQVNVHLIYIFSTTSPGGWLDETKVILNSTQFKLKLRLKLSLAIVVYDSCFRGYSIGFK